MFGSWNPRHGIIYRSWHTTPKTRDVYAKDIQVFININNQFYNGTFKASGDICEIHINKNKYITPLTNIKFFKKEIRKDTIFGINGPVLGQNGERVHNIQYVANIKKYNQKLVTSYGKTGKSLTTKKMTEVK